MKRKDKTIQRSIAWPESVYKAIQRQAKRMKVPVSSYIRYATEKQLRIDGEEVDADLLWGGYRVPDDKPEDKEAEPGQLMGAAIVGR